MIWLTWRQFRGQAIVGLIVLTALVAYFVITGLAIHHTYFVDQATCGSPDNCDEVEAQFLFVHSSIFNVTQILFIVLVGMAGIFWGAPLIAHEFETGTHQLAWTQSVTRGRWLAVKLLVLGAVSIVVVGLLGALLTWWSRPLDPIAKTRFWAQVFPTHGIVAIGYGLFAFAGGVTAGLLLRRTVPAIAVTLALFAGVQFLMPTVVRAHLVPATTVSYPIDRNLGKYGSGSTNVDANGDLSLTFLSVPAGAWPLGNSSAETPDNQPLHITTPILQCFNDPLAGTDEEKGGGYDATQIGTCLAGYHLHEYVTYQPEGSYWPMQWVETGVFTGLALLMSGFCFVWIRRR